MDKKVFTLLTQEKMRQRSNQENQKSHLGPNPTYYDSEIVLGQLAKNSRRPTSAGSYAYYARPNERRYLAEPFWFDGTKDYVRAGNLPAIGVGDSFSWSFWVFLRGPSSLLVGNRFGGSQCPNQFIQFTSHQFDYFRGRHNGSMPYRVPIAQWIHLCVVKNQESLLYYADGNVVGNNITTADIAEQPLYFGGCPEGKCSPCILNDVRLYTYALTASKVIQLSTDAQEK